MVLQPSCSDNALCLSVFVTGRLYWGLRVTSSFSIWGYVIKGCFERGRFWRARSRLKGIEDFNLEHRLKPSYEFHFERALKFQPFSWKVGSNPRRRSKNIEIEIQNSYLTRAWVIWYMFPVRCEELENQPSNSTSCSDNALCLLVLVASKLYWGLQVRSSFSIWGCIMKGCVEGGMFWRAKSRLKGIEDFNLEHWPFGRSHMRSQVPLALASPNIWTPRTVKIWTIQIWLDVTKSRIFIILWKNIGRRVENWV
jgi:hypothetical protein